MREYLIQKDYEYGEDGCVTTLYEVIDDSRIKIIEGDWYHDKIDDKIDGFFDCLHYLGVKHMVNYVNINEEDYDIFYEE